MLRVCNFSHNAPACLIFWLCARRADPPREPHLLIRRTYIVAHGSAARRRLLRRKAKQRARRIVSEFERASLRFASSLVHGTMQQASRDAFETWAIQRLQGQQAKIIGPDLSRGIAWLGLRAAQTGGSSRDDTPSAQRPWHGWTPFLLDHTLEHKASHTLAGWDFYPNPADKPKRKRGLGLGKIAPENPTGPRVNVAETAQYHFVRSFVQGFGSTYFPTHVEVLCTQDWTCPHCLPGKWKKPS